MDENVSLIKGFSDLEMQPKGAEFLRVDLHLHSPAVDSFAKPPGINLAAGSDRLALAKQYAKRLKKANIKVGAITDYNAVRTEWFSLIKEEARKGGIVILPGVELSFLHPKHGLHIIVIFEENEDVDAINRKIVSYNQGKLVVQQDGRHIDIESDRSQKDVLQDLKDSFNCILIAPHPSDDNGVLRGFGQQILADWVGAGLFDGIEHIPQKDWGNFLASQKSILDGHWIPPRLEFSDPRSLDDIGRKTTDNQVRATFLKLSTTTLGAIRLALRDPETRVSLYESPKAVYNQILGFQTIGANFLRDICIRFNENLSAIIGGRGVGKSAILETMRYVLDIPPYAEQSYRDELVHHALGSGGKGIVYFERVLSPTAKKRYRVERVYGESPRVFDAEIGKELEISPRETFGPFPLSGVFGQREIYIVSEREDFRLRLLDALLGEKVKTKAKEERHLVEELRANTQKILSLSEKLAKRADYEERLRAIDHELAVYQEQKVMEKLERVRALQSERQAIGRITSDLTVLVNNWVNTRSETRSILEALESASKGTVNVDIFEKLRSAVQNLNVELSSLLIKGIEQLEQTIKTSSDTRRVWDEKYKTFEAELSKIKQELRTEHLDPDRLLRLETDKGSITPLIDELKKVEQQIQSLRKNRRNLLSRLRDVRLVEHQTRNSRIASLNKALKGRLKIEVIYRGQRDVLRQVLETLLRGSRVSNEAIKTICAKGVDGIEITQVIGEGPVKIAEKFDITLAMAQRIFEWFKEDESKLFDLEISKVPDSVSIFMRVGEEDKPLNKLSVGQKCTALLLLLLEQKEQPLIIDQPEDDLDNRFVYEDIVKVLREQKYTRQIIVSTHNPNIPVLGDAELIAVLDASLGYCDVRGRASIDDDSIKRDVKMIMEGGDEAFRRRREKYGVE